MKRVVKVVLKKAVPFVDMEERNILEEVIISKYEAYEWIRMSAGNT